MTDRIDSGIRKGFIVLWTSIGLALIVGATYLADGWSDGQFWSTVLVNLGTTIFLAGFLVWLERRLVMTTREVAKEAASSAAHVAVEEATRTLSERLDAIQDRFEDRREQQARQEDAEVATLSDEISYARVMSAMTMADGLGVIRNSVKVAAGLGLHAPVVEVGFATESQQRRFDDESEAEIIGLRLAVDTSLYGTAYVVEADWFEDDDPVEVFGRLSTGLVRVGYGREARGLNIDRLFRNLGTGLEEGLAGRRGDEAAWRTTATLIEVIDRDWVVSDDGLEHREHGVVATRREITKPANPTNPFVPPTAPDWVDQETWNLTVRRARTRLPSFFFGPFG